MIRVVLAVALMSCFAPAFPVTAASLTAEQRADIVALIRNTLTQDPSILRDAIAAMQADDAKRMGDNARTAITTNHDALTDPADPAIGNPHGDVTIVEFFDPRCPYCRGIEGDMARYLKQDGSIRLTYKDLPVLGPPSVLGSRALLAAQKQGAYDKLREVVMSGPPDITEDSLRQMSQSLGLDWAKLQRDMDDPAIQQRLNRNITLAQSLGIDGTPSFVIGDTVIPGADIEVVRKAVAAARASAIAQTQGAPPAKP